LNAILRTNINILRALPQLLCGIVRFGAARQQAPDAVAAIGASASRVAVLEDLGRGARAFGNRLADLRFAEPVTKTNEHNVPKAAWNHAPAG
jgi:hypothetical protein